jgi:hypothetical protein
MRATNPRAQALACLATEPAALEATHGPAEGAGKIIVPHDET